MLKHAASSWALCFLLVWRCFYGETTTQPVNKHRVPAGGFSGLEATALGLNTCWVAGFFKPDSVASLVEIKKNERVLAITPVGYSRRIESLEEKVMTGFGRRHRRLPVSKLVRKTVQDKLPEWIEASIQAARLAPSAINRQRWGFDVETDSITVYVRRV